MENILLITDPNSDPDDLGCMVLLKRMIDEGKVNLSGVIACKGKAEVREHRARFAEAALSMLGLKNIPVAVGGEYQRTLGQGDDAFCLAKEVRQLLSKAHEVRYDTLKMVEEILEKHQKLTLLIIAPMNDVADFMAAYPELSARKIEKIVIMGGCKDGRGYPDEKPHNNAVCYEATVKVWQFATENNIPLIWVPRESVYQVQVEHDFYDRLEKTPHLLAQVMLLSNKKLLEMLWEDIHCGGFSHFDIRRFTKVFMGANHGDIKACEDFSTVWPKIRYFNLYDAVALMVLDKEIFDKAGYLEACPESKNVLIAKIKDAKIIRRRFYDGIIGQIEELSKEKKND